MRDSGEKGQAGIEYVILIGLLLTFLIPLIYYSLDETNHAVKMNQAEHLVTRLVKTVNSVNAVGPGTLKVVAVTVPKGVNNYTLLNHELIYNVTFRGYYTEIHGTTKPFINGTLPIIPGTYFIKVYALNTTFVNVGGGVSDVGWD